MTFLQTSLRFLAIAIVAGASGIALILSASYLYLKPKLPPANQITEVNFQIPLRIFSADDSLIAEFGSKRRIPVTYEQIPPDFIDAILAAEDRNFFEHGAVDFRGLGRAAYELVRYQQIRSGGSTITMQAARNFFLTLNQSFLRKFNEIVLAIQIENLLSKEDILTLYLNKIYLGHHAYGIAAAAQVYYNKPLAELNLAQMAMIAGLPKAPSSYNPITNPQRALIRRNWILLRMLELGKISEADYQLAAAQPVTARYHDVTPDIEARYVAETARQQVLDLLGEDAYTNGISVYTTISDKRQQAAVNALRQGLQDYDVRHGWRHTQTSVDITGLPALTITDPDELKSRLPVSDSSRIWARQLNNVRPAANLQPAIIAQVHPQSAIAVLKDAREVFIDWDGIEWAKPYVTDNRQGSAPTSTDGIIAAGDIVWLLDTSADQQPRWRLAQIPKIQGALISLDPQTGAIEAMQGGYSFRLSHFNRAIQAKRQPGSSFKPFIYTSALQNGMTPATLINDAPIVFSDNELETLWRPTGDTNRFYGPTRLREALYRSLNLAAVRLLQQLGLNTAFDTLEQLHLPTSQIPKDLSIVLGSASMTTLQMATAYSTFANGGYHVRPWLIKRIENSDGNTIWQAPDVILCNPTEHAPDNNDACPVEEGLTEAVDSGGELAALAPQEEPDSPAPVYRQRVLDRQTAWLMYSIMQDVIKKGTGRRALALNYPGLAGKTGTTNNQVDAWFAGFSPDLVATVWAGFDTPTSLGYREQGAFTALPIWVDYMRDALPQTPSHSIPEPNGISAVLINSKSGLRTHPGDPDAVFEYFLSNQLPDFDQHKDNNTSSAPQNIF